MSPLKKESLMKLLDLNSCFERSLEVSKLCGVSEPSVRRKVPCEMFASINTESLLTTQSMLWRLRPLQWFMSFTFEEKASPTRLIMVFTVTDAQSIRLECHQDPR